MSEETQAMTVLYRKLTADDVAHLMNDPRSSVFCKGDQFKVRDKLQARVDQLTEQNRELLEALCEIHNEVEGNIEPTVRDLVNQCGRNTPTNPNEIYEYCDSIKTVIVDAIRKATGEE